MYGAELTAIDPGPSMIAVARRQLPEDQVALHVSSFEDYQAPDGTFDLVVAATGFHWIDPEVALAKAARLLVTGGWFAVLSTHEQYDEPLGAALLDVWIRRSDDRAWLEPRRSRSLRRWRTPDCSVLRSRSRMPNGCACHPTWFWP
jgi:ubiquinone/menaquinone biosynthesis C-methylase UbiE